MDQPLVDVYLSGRLAPGLTTEAAAQRFAQLFKTTPETAVGLINGKPQLIKRGADEATAQKFRDALQRAGLEVSLRPQVAATPEPATTAARPVASEQTAAASALVLAPAGTDVLRPEERHATVTTEIDTSHLKMAPPVFAAAEHLTPEQQRAAIVAPPLSVAPAEGDLLRAEEKSQPLPAAIAPDLTLADPGALLETLTVSAAPVAPNLDGLSLAPAGEDLLRATEKPLPPTAVAPDISHLQLRE